MWLGESRDDLEQVIASGRGKGVNAVVSAHTIRGLASPVDSTKGMDKLEQLVRKADVVHLHNVMNPVALEVVAKSGKGVVTVQDHRVFCPSRGKVLPSGKICELPMSKELCAGCFDDLDYGERTLSLTERRLKAIRSMSVIVLSSYMARELRQLGVESRVIAPGVVAAQKPSEVGEGYLIGGRVVSHKGHSMAVDAWRMSGVESALKVAGEGPELASLDGVEQLGWLSKPELTTALRAARALIFPSDWQEPFGILGVEALAQGTPVVAIRTGGIEDWSQEGVVLVERTAIESMAEAIRELESDPVLVASLGSRGHGWVAEQLSPKERWGEVLEVYSDLTRGN